MTPAALFAGARRCGLLSTASYPSRKLRKATRSTRPLTFCRAIGHADAVLNDLVRVAGLALAGLVDHARSALALPGRSVV